MIGAGPAGLTAAYVLAKQGLSRITVLEADDIVGGISRTAQYKGYRFDIGGHRFFTKIEPVEDSGTRSSARVHLGAAAVAHSLQRQVLRLSAQGRQRAARPRPVERAADRAQLPEVALPAVPGRRELRAVGHEPLRQAAVRDLLQDLHRKGLGHSLHGDPRRMGGAAHPGAVAGAGDSQRDGAQQALDRRSRR